METDNIHLLQHLTTSISACYIKETDETDVLQTFSTCTVEVILKEKNK